MQIKDEPIIIDKPKKKKPKSHNKNINLIIFVLIVLSLLVAIPYYILVPKEETYELKMYDFSQVCTQDFIVTVPASGVVIPREEIEIQAPTTGKIVRIFQQAGDQVKTGDLLVELESETLHKKIQEAETLFKQKQKEKERLQLEYEYNMEQLKQKIQEAEELYQKLLADYPLWEKLFSMGDISKEEMNKEKKNLENAEKAVMEAIEKKKFTREKQRITREEIEEVILDTQNELTYLKKTLAATQIRASKPGKLIELPVKEGQIIKVGTKVAKIINEDSMNILGKVNQRDIDRVKIGQQVQIDTGGKSYAGKVAAIAPVAKESIVEIKVDFAEMPQNIRPQTAASLSIQIRVIKDQLALPRGSYLNSGWEKYVYVCEGDKAVKKEITYGLINGNYIQVRAGLNKDDQVITSSYDDFIHLKEVQLNLEGGNRI